MNKQTRSRSYWGAITNTFQKMRTRRTFWLFALALAIGALMASAGSSGPGAHASPIGSSGRTIATRILIESADVHIDDLPSAPDFELDLSISQTRNDCKAALRGQICLRYGISLRDQPIQFGYGLIPASDVKISGSTITLKTDTRHDPLLKRLFGAGGEITLTWSATYHAPSLAVRATVMRDATVHGTVLGYAIPRTNVTAAMLLEGSA